MKYLPFLSGVYSTAPGLTLLAKAADGYDQRVFQIDETYDQYVANKADCRKENIHKYYLEHNLHPETGRLINRYILDQLQKEYPQQFRIAFNGSAGSITNEHTQAKVAWRSEQQLTEDFGYLSLFDALCCQVQEDLAIVQLQHDNNEYLAAIHLCAPNHWSPGEKIGKSFSRIHDPVPNMERVLQNYFKMLSSIVTTRGPFTRFAWGIATDTRLNHHPEPPPGIEPTAWHGRSANNEEPNFFVRTERQNLVGFPEVNAFLFTIRTYFYDVESLSSEEKGSLLKALESMNPGAREYKGLTKTMDVIRRKLL